MKTQQPLNPSNNAIALLAALILQTEDIVNKSGLKWEVIRSPEEEHGILKLDASYLAQVDARDKIIIWHDLSTNRFHFKVVKGEYINE